VNHTAIKQIVWALTAGTDSGTQKLRLRSRHQFFSQVFRLVGDYGSRKVSSHGCNLCELGLETYVKRSVERLIDAIEPDDEQGEPPLLPIPNRYKPIGSTGEVNFKTAKPCFATSLSHINQVVADR
jgi:type III restriction enzyme